jgi:hypothetical protein
MVTEQTAVEQQNTPMALFPARHPMLRDGAVILALISTVCYFAFSEGVANFLGFLLKIFARLVHASG